jgi:ribonuclease VapC
MVVDTSAVLAVLFREDDCEYYAGILAREERKVMSPFNALEADIVIQARKGGEGYKALEQLFYHSGIEVLPFDSAMHTLALEAWLKYGKGRHPAALNMGDCCAYAQATYLKEPLLFKGNDFTQTDIIVCR